MIKGLIIQPSKTPSLIHSLLSEAKVNGKNIDKNNKRIQVARNEYEKSKYPTVIE